MAEVVTTDEASTLKTRRRVDGLDYLRFFAAAMVVGYHYFAYGVVKGHIDNDPSQFADVAKYGYLGVDLFFFISGFVIMNSARNRSAKDFAVSRATRLYPAFWCALILTTVVLALFGNRVGMSVTPVQFVANLTMAPAMLGQTAVDGVYWSLLFELKFYALVFVLLLAGQGRRLGTLMPYWAIVMLACSIMAPDLSRSIPFAGGFFAYFAVGAILAEVSHARRWTAIRLIGFICGLVVVFLHSRRYAVGVGDSLGLPMSQNVAVVVVGCWILLIGALMIRPIAETPLPWAQTAGALTYPIYLIHAAIGYVLMSFLMETLGTGATYTLTLVLIGLLAAGLHRLEEHPGWRRGFQRTLGRLLGQVPAATSSRR